MKYTVYTTDPERYLKGLATGFIMREFREEGRVPDGWAKVGEVEFTPTSPESDIREAAVKDIDREMGQKRADFTHGMEGLQRRKEELLAITHQPEVKS